MALKKQQKRSFEESQSVKTQNGTTNKKSQPPTKKAMIEKPVPKAAQKPAQKTVQSNGVATKKITKPKVVSVETKKAAKEETPATTLEAKNAAKRAKNADKMKKKNENRKEARKEQGQYKVDKIVLSPEALEVRIKEIESRPELTKTAKRRLGVLKKKLRVAQGLPIIKPELSSTGPIVSKTTKRHLRKARNAEKRLAAANSKDSETTVKSKTVEKSGKKVVAVAAAAATAAKVEATKQAKIVKPAMKKPQQVKPKEAKKVVVKKEEPKESDDDDEEDDEEEEDDSDDEVDESLTMKTDEEEDDDDDDDDEEEEEDDEEEEEEEDDDSEDDEEEEKEVVVPVKKMKQEQPKKQQPQQQQPKKEFKKDSVQSDDAEKKTRFVLFVGNLPYDASPEVIKKHFLTKVSSVSSVRVPNKPGTQESRGFAYVELENPADQEKGLSLHNTILNGRKINVEYTRAGSKPMGIRQDVVAKNRQLNANRKPGGFQKGGFQKGGFQKGGFKRQQRS